ncbi:MAG: hypothetical protein LBJ71_05285 [Holosporaceae bacterium]|nr:hypothetical protein [Holosporaceae bacterium]
MGRLLLFLFTLLEFSVHGVPIETPEFDERNEFVIQAPEEWGYRTFNGHNGLIGALWPRGTSFNSTDTAIFIFLQNNNEKLPPKPNNINLFTEKCPKAMFRFLKTAKEKEDDETLSIAEEYFSGRCGRTMVLFKEVISEYTVIIALVSARYVSKKQLADAKLIAASYRKEIRKYLKNISDDAGDADDNESDNKTEGKTSTSAKSAKNASSSKAKNKKK